MRRALAIVTLALTVGCGSKTIGGYGSTGAHYPDRIIAPEAYAASLEAAIAESRGEWAEAVTWLTKARDLDRDALDLQARLGLALCHVGKYDAAMFALADVLRIDDKFERARTARAQCWLLRQQPIEARKDLAVAIEADPEALEPQLILAELDRTSGAVAQAHARVEECARLHPNAPVVWDRLTLFRAARGDVLGAAAAKRRWHALQGVAVDAADTTFSHERDAHDMQCEALANVVAETSESAGGTETEKTISRSAWRASCDVDDATFELESLRASWSVARKSEVEALAAASAYAIVRWWGARMALRSLPLDVLLAASLPAFDDRESRALAIVRAGVSAASPSSVTERIARVREAIELAPAEPTVARLVAYVAKQAGIDGSDALRQRICWLAQTDVEKAACKESSGS